MQECHVFVVVSSLVRSLARANGIKAEYPPPSSDVNACRRPKRQSTPVSFSLAMIAMYGVRALGVQPPPP